MSRGPSAAKVGGAAIGVFGKYELWRDRRVQDPWGARGGHLGGEFLEQKKGFGQKKGNSQERLIGKSGGPV